MFLSVSWDWTIAFPNLRWDDYKPWYLHWPFRLDLQSWLEVVCYVTESTRAISHMCVWQALEAQPQVFRLLSSFFNVILFEFFTFPYRMFAIFQHKLSLVFRAVTSGVCCWCCKRGAFWLFCVARLRAISIRVWRQKQFMLNICYIIELFTEHSESRFHMGEPLRFHTQC